MGIGIHRLDAPHPGVETEAPLASVSFSSAPKQLKPVKGSSQGIQAALAVLAADAAKEAATRPGAAMLVTQTLRDGDNVALVGLARPWQTADGRLGGVALVAIGRSALVGLDLVRGRVSFDHRPAGGNRHDDVSEVTAGGLAQP